MYTGPPVIGAGLPQAGPSEVLRTVPLRVTASSESSDVPGAAVPFLQSTASGRRNRSGPPTVRQMGLPRHGVIADHLCAPGPTMISAITVHIVGAVPAAIAGAIAPLRVTVYLPGVRSSAQAGPAKPTAIAPNRAATATVRSILMRSPCRTDVSPILRPSLPAGRKIDEIEHPRSTSDRNIIIALGLYQGFTALDAIGPYEVLTYLPGAEMVICAERTGVVDDHNDLVHLRVDATFADVPSPDVLLVPGGPIAGKYAAYGHPIVDWIRAAHPRTTWTT